MQSMMRAALALFVACVAMFANTAVGDGIPDAMGTILRRPDKLEWKAAPATLPPGAMAAVLEGDPSKPGPFVMRLKFPDGYTIAPHTHPKQERVTVIAGTLHIGMGATFNKSKCSEMPVG